MAKLYSGVKSLKNLVVKAFDKARRPLTAGYCGGGRGARFLCDAAPILAVYLLILAAGSYSARSEESSSAVMSGAELSKLVNKGRYLTIIGVCSACHTSPNVSATSANASEVQERIFKTDPDWTKYLDPEGKNYLAGGVPFILRLGTNLSGIVYTTNITPDSVDGIGSWTVQEIADAIRLGRRPQHAVTPTRPEYLYLFPPHSFYHNLAEEDALALAYYLKSIPPKKSAISIPGRQLPPGFEPNADSNPFGPVSTRGKAPAGRSLERAQYLMSAVVGCRECHSHHSKDPELMVFVPEHKEHMQIFSGGSPAISEYKKHNDWDPAEPHLGPLIPFAGGGPGDPYEGVFRMGPDLPLRVNEKGISVFPYPGYAVLYGGNLTKFGNNGPHNNVTEDALVQAVRQGISPLPDDYGRPHALSQVMMWPFYSSMSDDDVYSIAQYIKSLTYIPNEVKHLTYYGTDWEAMFMQVFGGPPNEHDRRIFGKIP